jgi:arsenate reductase-like glutaredoxin family protein
MNYVYFWQTYCKSKSDLKKIVKYLLILVTGFMMITCAKIGSPPGGEKDVTPPVPKKSKPANYSTSYDKNKIIITFDEFITLKNQFTEFTISPPLKEKPTPLLRGKSIHVELPAEELDSSTYTLDFGQSIADNNEGNKLPNFQFVVSKNAYIDSFSIKGMIVDAFTHEPDKEQIYIFLNKNLSDSVPYTTIPSYLGRSDPEGNFAINHIAPGTYNIFALKDDNNNMLFDLPTEVIAFLDDPVYLDPDSFPLEEPFYDTIVSDSLISDSLIIKSKAHIADSVLSDSLISDSTSLDSMAFKTYGYSFNLYSFLEKAPFNQYLVDYSRNRRECLTIIFNEKQDTLPKVRLLLPDTTGIWYYPENNPTKDTLLYWLADSNLVNKDSILVEITHQLTDTNKITSPFTDTLLFRSKKEKESKSSDEKSKSRGFFRRTEEKEVDTSGPVIPRLPVKIIANKTAQDLNKPIIIETDAPILDFDEKKITLFRMEDTLEIPTKFTLTPDSLKKQKFILWIDYEPLTTYKMTLYEDSFTDIYHRTVDTTYSQFATQRDDYYGIINLDVKHVTVPVILQMFNKDNKLVKQFILHKDKKVKFDFLPPGQYSLKVIYDYNDNGHWDTGDLKEKRQPEKVDFYSKMLDVRSNWEVEYSWELAE